MTQPAGPSDPKAELRKTILARRDALSGESRAALSEVIFATITELVAFRQAQTVLAYASFGSEPVTDPFLRAVLALDKVLVLPKVNRPPRTLDLFRVTEPETQLEPGVWGIREPAPALCAPAALDEIDLVLVPGVVFDVRGGRTGYGGGYYDRLLARCPADAALVAAAFEVQIVEEVPMGPRDRRVDRVVTEQRVYPA